MYNAFFLNCESVTPCQHFIFTSTTSGKISNTIDFFSGCNFPEASLTHSCTLSLSAEKVFQRRRIWSLRQSICSARLSNSIPLLYMYVDSYVVRIKTREILSVIGRTKIHEKSVKIIIFATADRLRDQLQ